MILSRTIRIRIIAIAWGRAATKARPSDPKIAFAVIGLAMFALALVSGIVFIWETKSSATVRSGDDTVALALKV